MSSHRRNLSTGGECPQISVAPVASWISSNETGAYRVHSAETQYERLLVVPYMEFSWTCPKMFAYEAATEHLRVVVPY